VAVLALLLLLKVSSAVADPLTVENGPSSAILVLEPLDPAVVLAMTSVAGDHSTSVVFHNTLATPVDVWWRDYTGGEVLYNSLAPFESYVQLTFVTHPWLIRAHSDNAPLVGFLPAGGPGIANIVAFGSITPGPVPEPTALLLMGTGCVLLGRRLIKH
jgi:hypothetical protein